jgi:hypothetical protein
LLTPLKTGKAGRGRDSDVGRFVGTHGLTEIGDVDEKASIADARRLRLFARPHVFTRRPSASNRSPNFVCLVTAAAIPQDWDAEALYAKAQRYIECMQAEPSDEWQHALWSSFSLELLALAALSNISPALLADASDRNWQQLFHSLGFTPTEQKFAPRSIAIGEVLKRLKDIPPEFDNELEAFCILHTGRRNAELHSGATPFEGVDGASGWHAKFYRACIVLLKSRGYELSEFVGEEEDAVAAKLITAVKDETATSTKGDVNAHGKVWIAKTQEERTKLSASASAWAIKQTGHRVECPACQSDALLKGEPVAAPHRTIKDDNITEVQEYLPSQFECIACGLKISGLSRLSAIDCRITAAASGSRRTATDAWFFTHAAHCFHGTATASPTVLDNFMASPLLLARRAQRP